MSSESGQPDAAPPSDAVLERTLRGIVRKAEVDPITVKRVRTAAEERLGLDAGFFKSHDEWNEKSKEIIEDAFNQPSQNSPSPEPTPPKKAPSRAKTTKRTSTSKTKPASKRQKRSVSESEQSDFESEPEPEPKPKPKPKPAQSKSQTVISDAEEEQDGSNAEVQEKEVAAGQDSESEMSVVLDEAPPKRMKSTSAGPKTKAQPKAKAAKAAAKPSELSEEDQTIKRLQSELVKCGVRKLWHRELASYDTPKAKIGHLKQMLKDVGMTGRFSEQKAKAIKERRELEQDLEAVQEGAKQWGNDDDDGSESEDAPRPQRRATANRFVDFGEDDEDEDDDD